MLRNNGKFGKLILMVVGLVFLVACGREAEGQITDQSKPAAVEAVEMQVGPASQEMNEKAMGARESQDVKYFEDTSFSDQFESWLEVNPDFMGWISVPDLGISEAVVRGEDNLEYLRKDFTGNYAQAGTVFMDYRNIGNDFDSHRILYGHNLKDDQMFGPLRAFLDPDVFDPDWRLEYETLYGKEAYQVFSVYRVLADDYAYEIDNGDEYRESLLGLSQISIGAIPPQGARILTLSTCSYQEKNERLVVHAFLVEE